MKKILLIAPIVSAIALNSHAQGLVSINVNSGLFFASTNNLFTGAVGPILGTGVNGFYFELLTSKNLSISPSANDILIPSNLAQWTDTGVSGNSWGISLNAGKIQSAGSTTANGWLAPTGVQAPGGGLTYNNEQACMIVGWSGNFGTTYSQFLSSIQSIDPYDTFDPLPGYIGYTAVSYNYAGGGPDAFQTVNMWGNQTGTPDFGINQGLVLFNVVPEPGTIAMAALGGLSLLAFRSRKSTMS